MTVICARCGNQNPDGTAFCTRCGQPLVEAPPAADAAGAAPPAATPGAAPPVAVTPGAAAPPSAGASPPAPPPLSAAPPPAPAGGGRLGRNAIIAIAVAVLLLAGGGVAAFAAFNHGPSPAPTPVHPTAPSPPAHTPVTTTPTPAPTTTSPTPMPSQGGSGVSTAFVTGPIPRGWSIQGAATDTSVVFQDSKGECCVVFWDLGQQPDGTTLDQLRGTVLQTPRSQDPNADYCSGTSPQTGSLPTGRTSLPAEDFSVCFNYSPQNGPATPLVDEWVAGLGVKPDGTLEGVAFEIFNAPSSFDAFNQEFNNAGFMLVFPNLTPP